MPIPKSRLRPASTQYEESFKTLYREVRERMLHVPKRRRDAVAKPVMDAMNTAYKWIMAISEDPIKGDKNKQDVKLNAIIKAQEAIWKIQKPLYVYWNICNDPDEPGMHAKSAGKRATLCDQLNDVLKMLHAMQVASPVYDPVADKGMRYIMYYQEKDIKNAMFLKAVQKFHRFTSGKLIKLSSGMKMAEGDLIQTLADDIWFHSIEGNRKPVNMEEVELRRKHFSIAISGLYKIQRPILSIMNTEGYSNAEIEEWMNLINTSLKLVQAVQRADKERFKYLE